MAAGAIAGELIGHQGMQARVPGPQTGLPELSRLSARTRILQGQNSVVAVQNIARKNYLQQGLEEGLEQLAHGREPVQHGVRRQPDALSGQNAALAFHGNMVDELGGGHLGE